MQLEVSQTAVIANQEAELSICSGSLGFHQRENMTLSCTADSVNTSWMKPVVKQRHLYVEFEALTMSKYLWWKEHFFVTSNFIFFSKEYTVVDRNDFFFFYPERSFDHQTTEEYVLKIMQARVEGFSKWHYFLGGIWELAISVLLLCILWCDPSEL